LNEKMNWIALGLLNESSADFSGYSKDIGLYRATLNGVIVYIGKATELNNGGFRKRLRDYTRASSSARNYPSGLLMHRHRDELEIEILIFERSIKSVPEIEAREKDIINQFNPDWNNKDKEQKK
jgi:hypothetical protein